MGGFSLAASSNEALVIQQIAITVLAAVAFATSIAMTMTSMTTTTTMPSRAGTG